MLTKKWLLVGGLSLVSLSLAMAAPPAVHPTTGEPLVITCLRGTPEAIDGDLGDWNLEAMTPAVLDVTGQLYTGQASWTGPEDCSGKFYLLWDDTKIYVAVIGKDDKLSINKTDGNIWNGDCVEVFFSTTNAVTGHTEHYQYGFNANAQKWNWCNMDSGGQVLPDYMQVGAKKTPGGYTCEVSIEYGRMSGLKFVAGTAIGFHPCIDDTDATDRELQITWTSREAHDQSLGFGHMILSSDPAMPRELGRSPNPANRAVDVPVDTIPSWSPGQYAASHDVYFGTASDAVTNAARDNPMGALASQGQAAVEFDPTSLAYGTTYYWRVDEVNAPPSATIYKGSIWSFTTEPYTYTIPSVTATASSASVTQGMTAVKTVDGSGLSAEGLHSSVDVDGWLSAPGIPLPAWIQYQFSQVYKVRQMKVWNSNQKVEPFLGFGAKSVLIEYSLDGTTWTTLKTEEFPQASGTDTYAGFMVDLGDVLAKYVRLTIQSNWGGFIPQSGLSEVRFGYIPVQAFAPQPAAAATGVSVNSSLNWRPGREAGSHKVFFGTEQAAVADGTVAAKTTTEHSYVPDGLTFGTTYYWKVDEVNTVTYPGDLWSFSTLEYMAVDDFENYSNDSPKRLFQTWIDGAGFSPDEFFPSGNPGNATCSLVGYDPTAGDIMETSIVHGGMQAMPIEYNNVTTPYRSEVSRTLDETQNWATNGATDVSLWFRGHPAKFATTADGHSIISSTSGDTWGTADYFRFAYKQLNGDGSISVKINSVSNAADWSKAGVMIRESLDSGSQHGFMVVTPSGRRAFQNRATTGGDSVSAHSDINKVVLPFWLKLERKGNQLTASYSTDGKAWTRQPDTENTGADSSPNPQTMTMSANVYVGLGVASNNASASACVADFSDIVTSGSVTGQWQVADIGGDNPGNDPAPVYLVIEDKAGKKKTIVNGNAGATTVAAWTEWRIPLSDLSAGVNLTAVKKITIGVGDQAGSTAGGAGMLFIDDIGYGHPLSSQ